MCCCITACETLGEPTLSTVGPKIAARNAMLVKTWYDNTQKQNHGKPKPGELKTLK